MSIMIFILVLSNWLFLAIFSSAATKYEFRPRPAALRRSHGRRRRRLRQQRLLRRYQWRRALPWDRWGRPEERSPSPCCCCWQHGTGLKSVEHQQFRSQFLETAIPPPHSTIDDENGGCHLCPGHKIKIDINIHSHISERQIFIFRRAMLQSLEPVLPGKWLSSELAVDG